MVVAAGLTDVNFALSFWTALTFLILIVVLGKFAWGPILQMLETRERTIAEAIESAEKERRGTVGAFAGAGGAPGRAATVAVGRVRRIAQEAVASRVGVHGVAE